MAKWEIYPSCGRWRWVLRDQYGNGRMQSDRSYETQDEALSAVDKLKHEIFYAPVVPAPSCLPPARRPKQAESKDDGTSPLRQKRS